MGIEIDVEALKKSMSGGGKKSRQENSRQNNKHPQSGNYNNRTQSNSNNNKQHENYNKGGYNNSPAKYVGAPYNFISFSNDVYKYKPGQFTGHEVLSDEHLTGEIEYEIIAQTPIMVSQGNNQKGEPEKFHRNEYGQYSVPGSTMRGLIRNNVQILGLSSMGDDIDDYALMYRNVAGGKEKERYKKILDAATVMVDGKNVSVLRNVKAGYIAKENGRYVIYQTCKDSIKAEYKAMNYYILSERRIVSEYLSSKKNNTTFAYSFFEKDGKSRMQHELDKQFEKNVRGGRVHYKGEKNNDYHPYYKEISYELAGYKDVIAVGNKGMYPKKGYVISSGRMDEKKAVYIIPEIDTKKIPLEIPDADITAFKIDYKKRENVLSKIDKSFFALPKDGEIKPVFYIYLDGRLYFGFTPRLRLFYDYTIKEGLNEKHKDGSLDYAKAIFGYSSKTESYKSRVSFSDAVLVNDMSEQDTVNLVLAEPKPTSYSDYVAPDKEEKAMTYNDKGFRLRGTKQYWLHKEVVSATAKYIPAESSMRPLERGSIFRGRVRFKNLTPDELGLLIWSMKLEKDSWMNVGKAKAYGYGNISLQILSVKKVNPEKAYKNNTTLCLNPWESISEEKMIHIYKETINKTISGEIDKLPHIREFFMMKDASVMPIEDSIKYMNLNNKEYQFRRDKVLPSISSLVEKK